MRLYHSTFNRISNVLKDFIVKNVNNNIEWYLDDILYNNAPMTFFDNLKIKL